MNDEYTSDDERMLAEFYEEHKRLRVNESIIEEVMARYPNLKVNEDWNKTKENNIQTESTEKEDEDSWQPTPAPDWDIPVSEEMDADAFVKTLMDMDKATFWRLAEEAGLRTDLLKKVGYEYKILSDDTGYKASRYLKKHLNGWPKSEKSVELMTKMYAATLHSTRVSRQVEWANEYRQSDFSLPSLDDLLSHSLEQSFIQAHVGECALSLFIEEFRDDLTPVRRELLDLYGSSLITEKTYLSFLLNGGFRMVLNIHLAQGGLNSLEEEAHHALALCRFLRKDGNFSVQSDRLKGASISIGSDYVKVLLQEAIMKLMNSFNDLIFHQWKEEIKLLDMYGDLADMGHPGVGRYTPKLLEDEELLTGFLDVVSQWLKMTEANDKDIQDYEVFYYGAYSIIDWPDKYTWTDKCIFLYKLAHLCGFDQIHNVEDFTNGFARKEITDRIKRIIKKYATKDHDGELLKKLLRERRYYHSGY